MKRAALCLAVVLSQPACSSQDPCRAGELRSDALDRCVPRPKGPAVQHRDLDDASMPHDDAVSDACLDAFARSALPDAGDDAHVQEDGSFDTRDGSDGRSDARVATDAAGDGAESVPWDAAGDAAQAAECSASDQQAWASFHLSDQLVESIKSCVASDPSCALAACPLDTCLRETAGVTGCVACVQAEVRCVAANCISDCGSASDDARCRACACRNGCVDEFSACAGSVLDVCADCNDTTCAEMSVLPPELIMVVVSSLLR